MSLKMKYSLDLVYSEPWFRLLSERAESRHNRTKPRPINSSPISLGFSCGEAIGVGIFPGSIKGVRQKKL
jgi:hypothetical protein